MKLCQNNHLVVLIATSRGIAFFEILQTNLRVIYYAAIYRMAEDIFSPIIDEFIMDGKLVQGKRLGTRLVQPL
jgi:hypothetical protein